MPRLLLGLVDVAGTQMNLCERGHGLRSVCITAGLERDPECRLEQHDRLVRLAEQEVQAAEVVRELPDVHLVGELLVRATCLLGVGASEHPVPFAVGDERGLEIRGADRARVIRALCELQRALDVLARGFVVALTAPAPRAPGKDVRTQRVGREPRALGEAERLVEERKRRLDTVQLVATDAEDVEDLRPLDVREASALDVSARLVQQLECTAQRAEAHLRAAGADERADLELQEPGGAGRRNEHVILRRGLLVAAGLDQCFRARQRAFEAPTLVGGDAVREEARVDAQAHGEPVDRLPRRTGLAALDLGDVLLREPIARELALRQAGGHAQLAQALAADLGI